MTFAISVDTDEWRAHTATTRDRIHAAEAAVIAVVKANGYGLGQALLASEAARLGLRAIAVGTVFEVASVVEHFDGDVIVLEPIDDRDGDAALQWAALQQSEHASRLIATVATSRALDLVIDTFSHPRVLLEGVSSMRRFGFDGPRLKEVWTYARQAVTEGRLRLHGLSVHLPLNPNNADFDELLQLADEVPDDELQRRRAAWTPPPQPFTRGFTRLFQQHVTQAHLGCDFDFLQGNAATPEPVIF